MIVDLVDLQEKNIKYKSTCGRIDGGGKGRPEVLQSPHSRMYVSIPWEYIPSYFIMQTENGSMSCFLNTSLAIFAVSCW